MKKLWIIVVAVMVSAFALTGCGGSAGAKSVESAQSAVSSSAVEPASSSEVPTADEKATITIQDDKNGTAVQKVALGERIAELTVPFQYEEKDGKRVLTEIGKATAKKVSGWDSVKFDASENQKVVSTSNGGAEKIVRVIYHASIGSGDATYEGEVTIDLSDVK